MGNSPKNNIEINTHKKLKIDCKFLSHLTNSALFISKTGYTIDFKINEINSLQKTLNTIVDKMKLPFKRPELIRVSIVSYNYFRKIG